MNERYYYLVHNNSHFIEDIWHISRFCNCSSVFRILNKYEVSLNSGKLNRLPENVVIKIFKCHKHMCEFLRQYSYSEFISEYGMINNIDFEKKEITTSEGVIVHLSHHYCKAIENNVLQLDLSNLRYAYFILFAEDKYDKDGNKCIEKVWYLFHKGFLSLPRNSSYFVLFKNTNYKIVQRRNFCRLLIQYDSDKFFQLENVDIFIFEYHGNHSYSIETNKGTLNGQFTSRCFISAFAKILSLNSTSNDRSVFIFILYMDGHFERISNSPTIANF